MPITIMCMFENVVFVDCLFSQDLPLDGISSTSPPSHQLKLRPFLACPRRNGRAKVPLILPKIGSVCFDRRHHVLSERWQQQHQAAAARIFPSALLIEVQPRCHILFRKIIHFQAQVELILFRKCLEERSN